MKLNKRLWILLAVIFAVFNVIAFILPFAHTAAFWVAYGCTLIMFGALAVVSARIFKKDTTPESVILGWPILRVAYVSLIIQLIAFFVFAALAKLCPAWITVIVEVVLLAAAFICLLVKDTAKEVVQQSEQVMQDNTQFIKQLRAQAKSMANSASPELQASLEKLSDALRYADPVSGAATADIEAKLAEKLTAIASEADAAACKALISEAIAMVGRRAEICKTGKK